MRLIDLDALGLLTYDEVKLAKVLHIVGKRSGKLVLIAREIIYHFLANAPTIDPESLRPKGRWVGEGDGYADGELVYDVWYCSECNHCIDDGTDDPEMLPNYCPNCGAKMEG